MNPKTGSLGKRLVLKAGNLLETSGHANAHQLALNSRSSASTISRYISEPEKVHAMDLSILYRILSYGLELTDEQILKMPLGEVFEIQPAG